MWSFRKPWIFVALVVGLAIVIAFTFVAARSSTTTDLDDRLDAAIDRLIARTDGPPGIAIVVQRHSDRALHSRGTGVVGTSDPIAVDDHVRVASVSKAFTGAVALALVASDELSLDDTVGTRLPTLPTAWADVTVRELMQHTSGVPDFSGSPAFRDALVASLLEPPPPAELLAYVADEPLEFTPGSQYRYSNSDNIIVALMVEAVTAKPFSSALSNRVLDPLQLNQTSLPTNASIPAPSVHGYVVDPPTPPEDATEQFAAGWTWSSGGVVSTPADANRFVRAYARGATTDSATRQQQFRFVPGNSEPPGPGTNAAGLSIFRYRTRCGTVYGHTGNTAGYTQFIAANARGTRSVSVSVNAQITPKSNPRRFVELRKLYELAVCTALR